MKELRPIIGASLAVCVLRVGFPPIAVARLRRPRRRPMPLKRPCPRDRRKWVESGHSITSSARARIAGGTVRPSALAVLRLTTSLKVVGCWTGRSAGFSPFRIFPA
jgi:hypothetical protein